MWWLLLACSDSRPIEGPLSVPRGPPWHGLALPAGRDVASGPHGLTVRLAGSTADVERSWHEAVLALGFELREDRSREDRVSRTYERVGAPGSTDVRWAMAVTEVDGEVVVDLRVLPELTAASDVLPATP
jgi:hypothetical protein